MGEIYRISCPECKKEWSVKEGYGIRYTKYRYKISLCRECGNFVSVRVNSEGTKEILDDCPICGKPLSDIFEETVKIKKCPRCNAAMLKVETAGQWD